MAERFAKRIARKRAEERQARSTGREVLSWGGLEAALLIFYGAISTPVVALLLGPNELGKAGVIMAVVALAEIFTGLGLQEALIRSPSSHTRLTDTANTVVLALSFVGMAAIMLAAGPISALYGDPSLAGLLQLASTLLPLNACIIIPVATLTRKFRAKRLSVRNIVARTFVFAVTIVLGFLGAGATGVVLGSIAGSLASALLILSATPRLARPAASWAELKPLMSYGAAIVCESLVVSGFLRIFALLLGYTHGVTAVGYFQLGQRLVDEVALIIQTMITRYGVAYFSALHRRGQSIGDAFLLGTRILAILSIPAFAGLTLCAHDIVQFVFGDAWLPAIPVLQFSAIAWLIAFPTLLMPPLLRAQGHQNKLVLYAFASAALSLAVLAASTAMPLWVAGAAWAARQLFALPWTAYASAAYFNIGPLRLFEALWRPVAAATLMAIFIDAVLPAFAADLPTAFRLMFAICSGAALYTAAVLALDRQQLRKHSIFSRHGESAPEKLPDNLVPNKT